VLYSGYKSGRHSQYCEGASANGGRVRQSAGVRTYDDLWNSAIPRLSQAGMPSRSEGWGGLFKDEQYRLNQTAGGEPRPVRVWMILTVVINRYCSSLNRPPRLRFAKAPRLAQAGNGEPHLLPSISHQMPLGPRSSTCRCDLIWTAVRVAKAPRLTQAGNGSINFVPQCESIRHRNYEHWH